MIDMTIH